MADIELEALSAGVTSLQGDVVAARFLEAEITSVSSVSGDSSAAGTGGVAGQSSGAATASVEGDGVGVDLTSVSDGVGSVAALVERYRDLAGAAGGAAATVLDLRQRLGLSSTITPQATIQARLGAARPMLSDVVLNAEPAATVETTGFTAQDIYLQVTGTPTFNNNADPTTGDPGSWTLPVTLRRGGNAGSRVPAGAALVKWGQYSATPTADFTGGIILTSDMTHSPYVDVFTVAKNVGGTVMPWDDAAVKPRVRMGNLRGVLGNVTDKWGIAMSTDLSSTSAPYIEASNAGLTVKDANLNIINGTLYVGDAGNTKFMQWNGSALIIRGEIRADSGYLSNLTISGTLRTGVSPNPRIEISNTQIAGYSNATTRQFYLQASDGVAYAGAGAVRLGSAGIGLVYNLGNPSAIKWHEASFGAEVARINAYFSNPVPRLELSSAGSFIYIGGALGNVYASAFQTASLHVANTAFTPGHISGSVALGCRVYNTATQSLPNNTVTPLTFNTESDDVAGNWSAGAPTRLTAQHPGYYIVGGNWEMQGAQVTAEARVATLVRKNATTFLAIGDSTTLVGQYTSSGVSTGMVWLDPGDYVEICAYQNLGATKTVSAATLANMHICNGWMTRVA